GRRRRGRAPRGSSSAAPAMERRVRAEGGSARGPGSGAGGGAESALQVRASHRTSIMSVIQLYHQQVDPATPFPRPPSPVFLAVHVALPSLAAARVPQPLARPAAVRARLLPPRGATIH